ncbi:MAG: hypothetical protein H7A25_12745 [Leptospiraceae bacterium]|nr:hypothetical protein [Leptospiraceae bacterium]MCP5500767.1 hypothetical protein [Leptospiraceae bacterium]
MCNTLASNYSWSFTTEGKDTYSWGTFTDQFDGTIKFEGVTGTFGGNSYTAKTLYFAKCTHGQTYNSSANNCQGAGSAGDN